MNAEQRNNLKIFDRGDGHAEAWLDPFGLVKEPDRHRKSSTPSTGPRLLRVLEEVQERIVNFHPGQDLFLRTNYVSGSGN